jgi:hypothetical protein
MKHADKAPEVTREALSQPRVLCALVLGLDVAERDPDRAAVIVTPSWTGR